MSENNTEHVHDENCNHEHKVPTISKEIVSNKVIQCTNDAIAALTPLLDDETTQPIGMTLLKSLDKGLSALEKQSQIADMNSQTHDTGQPAGGLPTVPQNVQVDEEQNKKVSELVDQTLQELESMEDHESPTYTTESGDQAEYVKGMLCNCQFASEFHKYCDNQCKEHLIKATGNTSEYLEYLDTAKDEISKQTLDEAITDVDAFVNEGIGMDQPAFKPKANMQGQDGVGPLDVHKGGPYPNVKHPQAVQNVRDTPGQGPIDVQLAGQTNRPADDPIEELTGEKNEKTDEYGNILSTEGKLPYEDGSVKPQNQYALDPSQPVVMPGEDGTQQ